MKRIFPLLFVILMGTNNAYAWEMPDWDLPDIDMNKIKKNISAPFKGDARQQEMRYIHNLQKQEVKEKHEKRVLDRNPSGFMTVEEYELLAAPKDKTIQEIEIPRVEKGSDMKYVPQPTYKIVRYNNPPGSPELSIKRKFYAQRQQNAQGIVSPDFSILVYPSIYYYPSSASVACDLFVIPLEENETNLNKIMKANVMHRWPDAILSTDKSVSDNYAFRTLTPIDFSVDGSKLLVKEKVGYSKDGIWQTNAIVYDFTTKTSYDLKELRAAVVYYWKQYKDVDLDDKRWDIYPLGFDINEPDRVVSYAYAYTGEEPVFLGSWSIDSKGEQTRLISFNNKDVQISINGFKIVQDGVVPPDQLLVEEEQVKRFEKAEEKRKKAEEKAEIKKMNEEYKTTIKQMNTEYKKDVKEYKYQNKVEGSTTRNDTVQKYEEEKVIRDQKEAEQLEKKKQREAEKEQRRLEKEKQKAEKERIKKEQEEIKRQEEAAAELEKLVPVGTSKPEMDLNNINFDEL